jgi:hypothetical protein
MLNHQYDAGATMKTLQSQADIRDFFHRNQTPLYYVSTSTFNLLGADEWVNNLTFINTINSGVEYALDVEQFNRRWVDAEQTSSWSQMIIEHTADAEETLTRVPASGIWRMEPDGTLQFSRPALQPQAVASDTEAFFLRTVDPGHTSARGQSVGRLLTHGRLMTDDYRLTERAKAWIHGLRAHFGAAHATHDLLLASAYAK